MIRGKYPNMGVGGAVERGGNRLARATRGGKAVKQHLPCPGEGVVVYKSMSTN